MTNLLGRNIDVTSHDMLPREEYNRANKDRLQVRYEDVCIAIIHAHKALAQSHVAELSKTCESYSHSTATSISAMDREADLAAYPFRIAVFEARGELASLEAERDLIEKLLT